MDNQENQDASAKIIGELIESVGKLKTAMDQNESSGELGPVVDMNESVGGISFTFPNELPTSPKVKPVLSERRQTHRDSPSVVDERREKIIDAIRTQVAEKVVHVVEVKDRVKAAECEAMHKAKADSDEKLKKADDLRAEHIEAIKDQQERTKEREAATKATRDELATKALERYRDAPVVSLEKEAIAEWTIDKLNQVLTSQDDHKKALLLIVEQDLFGESKTKDEILTNVDTVETNRQLLIGKIDEKLSDEMEKATLAKASHKDGSKKCSMM